MAKNPHTRDIPKSPSRSSRFRIALLILVLLISCAGSLTAWPVYRNAAIVLAASRQLYRTASPETNTEILASAVHGYRKIFELRVGVHIVHDAVDRQSSNCPARSDLSWITSNEVAVLSSQHKCVPIQPLTSGSADADLKQVQKLVINPVKHSSMEVLSGKGIMAAAIITDKKSSEPPSLPPGPTPLAAISDHANCNAGITLNIVAHEDDDLLFMNPDLQTDITAGRCIRTVFLTAGDSGQSALYWKGREQGSKAAYAAMYGVENSWHDEQQLLEGRLVNVSLLDGVPQAALMYLRLPDGNLHGEGFGVPSSETLYKLLAGEIPAVHTLDSKIAYTKNDVVGALTALMQADVPDHIRTQNPNGSAIGDHSDHAVTAILAGLASDKYVHPHMLSIYDGYPDRLSDTNLTGEQIAAKQSIFLTYAQYDNAVCHTPEECSLTLSYGNYLTREYKLAEVASGQ
jgi:LmbE family N-acetylglucosaminyl deacetylase